MDELEAYFGKDKLLESAIEHALLKLAAERIGAEIWEWGEVGLVLGLDLIADEGRHPSCKHNPSTARSKSKMVWQPPGLHV